MASPLYIDASRVNSISNNDEKNNEWTYKLNEGTIIPAGSTVQVISSFINKQGITDNSIELTDDINETFSIGYTVPQTAMWQQKPERTAADDRLQTASLENPNECLSLETPEISVPLTNYYDCMVQHNPVHSAGMDLFTKSIPSSQLAYLDDDAGGGINIVCSGDWTTEVQPNMTVVFKDIVHRNASAEKDPTGRQATFNRNYFGVSTVQYFDFADTTIITTKTGGDLLLADGGNYISGDNFELGGSLYYTDTTSETYKTCTGVAYLNSYVGTSAGGETYYQQTKLNAYEVAYEGAGDVVPLEGQKDDMNYQGGVRSDICGEEFRGNCADPTRDIIWNASGTSVSQYDFDRCSYSFYFAPSYQTYDAGTSAVQSNPAFDTSHFDFEDGIYGPNGHNIRMDLSHTNVGYTGENNVRNTFTSEAGTSMIQDDPWYPYQNALPYTEYPYRRDLCIPKPGQPAKTKDKYCPQVDYLRNGDSWDSAPMRCEIFTVNETEMVQFGGAQDPFQPYIYQNREGQEVTEETLKTLDPVTFLDRVTLSQSQIRGLLNRSDSHPYVKRSITFDVQNIGSDAQYLVQGDIMFGQIIKTDQTAAVQELLFPARAFRSELDPSDVSSSTIYNTEEIQIACMIDKIENEGTTSATITSLIPLSNLNLTGATITDFIYPYSKEAPFNPNNSTDATFQSFDPYPTLSFDNITLKITVDSEDWTDHQPQYIPCFAAKGMQSDLPGDTPFDAKASGNDTSGGARFNYFIDGMHNQTQLDYFKIVGEDYAINPNHSQNLKDFIGEDQYRVGSHPYFNWKATASGLRDDLTRKKRIYITQRGNSEYGGIHPKREFSNPTSEKGLTNFQANYQDNLQTSNYLFGSTRHCSMGALRPPGDREFSQGQVVTSIPTNSSGTAQPENNGITPLYEVLQDFDIDDPSNVLKLKIPEERAPNTMIQGIPATLPVDPITNPAKTQETPFGTKNSDHVPNCNSALGDYELYPYSTPATNMMDTGGTNDPLCLVQLQAIIEDYSSNYNDYVLRPLTTDINIQIPKGVYSIPGFLDKFNSQIQDLDLDDNQELSTLDNNKTVRRFTPLQGQIISGGQVSLINDFTEDTHNRTIYSSDPDALFNTNPLVIAIRVQDYNDLCRAWQMTGTAQGVSFYLKGEDSQENCYLNGSTVIGGGSYVWYNFRDKCYWAEFVDKYSDKIENIIEATEDEDLENFDTQFYFSENTDLDDTRGNPWSYGALATLGIGDGGVRPIAYPEQSTLSQYKIEGNIEAKIDKLRNYNATQKGIYVGAPDFALSYNQDNGFFSLSNLHWGVRVPTVDLVGETAYPDSAINQKAILYRSYSQLLGGDYQIMGQDSDLRTFIKNSLQTPQDQISGIFIFNLAKRTSQEEGDFINSDSVEIGRIYNDYFSNNEVAEEAWKNTIWARLGFAYSTFNTQQDNRLASYYLQKVSTTENTSNPLTSQTSYFSTTYADTIATVKSRTRQVLCTNLSTGAAFNDVSDSIDDNYLPGVTTGEQIDSKALETIASAPGTTEGQDNTLVRLYNNASISSVRSMSGGYVYYPIKLGNWDTFDGTVNYTAANISAPADGYIFQSPRNGITYITSKSGSAIPEDEQLAYNRSYEFAATTVPSYNPTTYYSKTYDQAVDGTTFPVAYSMDNYAYLLYGAMGLVQESQFNLSNGIFRDRSFTLEGSMFLASQSTPILSSSDDIQADSLPTLTENGYYIITSDIVKQADSIKGDVQLPILGVAPISSLSSQDYLTAFNNMPHTINQDLLLNSINIKILNADLTNPTLEKNSSIIIRIDLPQPSPQPPLPLTNEAALEEQKKEMAGEIK